MLSADLPRNLRLVRAKAVAALASCALVAACDGIALFEVAPTATAPGATITLDGRGFDATMSARLESPSGAAVILALGDVGPTTAKATVPAATPAGTWDVVVSARGDEDRLAAALDVRAGALVVRFLDVGQGDGTLVTGPDGSTLLVDGGNRDAGAGVVAALRAATGGRLDAVAVTHTDADHLGGVVHVLRGDDGVAGTVDDVVPATRWIGHPDSLCSSDLCAEFRTLRARFSEPLVGDHIDLGGASIDVLGRDGDFGDGVVDGADDENERCLTLRLTFAGRTVFLGGDLTGGGLGNADVEAEAARVTGPVDVLRINHHGSATSSSPGFLRALQPRAVVLSVGTDNAFCHPAPSVLDRLDALGAPVWATGSGMVAEGGRCDGGATTWPTGARAGHGTITLTIDADGSLNIDGDPL